MKLKRQIIDGRIIFRNAKTNEVVRIEPANPKQPLPPVVEFAISDNERINPINKRCPYCSEEILFEAKKCKHCGEYLDDNLKPKTPPAQITQVVAKEGCFLQSMNIGCAIVVGLVVLFIIIFTILSFINNK